jgi:hypothetical protein
MVDDDIQNEKLCLIAALQKDPSRASRSPIVIATSSRLVRLLFF